MRKPIVSVIGRPNVGKSTLFNKLVGKRVAITEDTPGVTRDRLYRDAEWQNKEFTLVDTGGLDTGSEEVFLSEIRAQAQVAIDQSDVVLFVVDGRDGLTHEDHDIAKMLRRSKKPVILVINKIDSARIPDTVYEFYELGFDDASIVSAEQSMGLGDLLDKVTEYFSDEMYDDETEEITKIAIIGKPNVGKSSFINRLLEEDRMIVTDIAGTTRDAIDSYYKHGDDEYILIDTAGLRRRRAINEDLERYSVSRTLDAVDRADMCLLIVDAAEGISEQDTKIAGYAHDRKKAMIVLVNKWDLIDKDDKSYYDHEAEIKAKLSFMSYAPILFISVKTGQRLNKVFDVIKMVDNNYSMRINTGILNDIFREAMYMSPPPTDKGRRLKLFYITQISVRAPKFLLFVNNKELLHFSYLRYLENQLRKKYGFEGVPLTFELREREDCQ